MNAVFRAITKLPERRERSVVTSSVMPSTKNSCSGSFDRLAKGRTTIDNRGRADGMTALAASRVLVVVEAELGTAGVGGARRPGMLPRIRSVTLAVRLREVDATSTGTETAGSDAMAIAPLRRRAPAARC